MDTQRRRLFTYFRCTCADGSATCKLEQLSGKLYCFAVLTRQRLNHHNEKSRVLTMSHAQEIKAFENFSLCSKVWKKDFAGTTDARTGTQAKVNPELNVPVYDWRAIICHRPSAVTRTLALCIQWSLGSLYRNFVQEPVCARTYPALRAEPHKHHRTTLNS